MVVLARAAVSYDRSTHVLYKFVGCAFIRTAVPVGEVHAVSIQGLLEHKVPHRSQGGPRLIGKDLL